MKYLALLVGSWATLDDCTGWWWMKPRYFRQMDQMTAIKQT